MITKQDCRVEWAGILEDAVWSQEKVSIELALRVFINRIFLIGENRVELIRIIVWLPRYRELDSIFFAVPLACFRSHIYVILICHFGSG